MSNEIAPREPGQNAPHHSWRSLVEAQWNDIKGNVKFTIFYSLVIGGGGSAIVKHILNLVHGGDIGQQIETIFVLMWGTIATLYAAVGKRRLTYDVTALRNQLAQRTSVAVVQQHEQITLDDDDMRALAVLGGGNREYYFPEHLAKVLGLPRETTMYYIDRLIETDNATSSSEVDTGTVSMRKAYSITAKGRSALFKAGKLGVAPS